MANEPRLHPVYTAINQPLTVWVAERRGLQPVREPGRGLLTFAVLYAGARLATVTDPQILRILLISASRSPTCGSRLTTRPVYELASIWRSPPRRTGAGRARLSAHDGSHGGGRVFERDLASRVLFL